MIVFESRNYKISPVIYGESPSEILKASIFRVIRLQQLGAKNKINNINEMKLVLIDMLI